MIPSVEGLLCYTNTAGSLSFMIVRYLPLDSAFESKYKNHGYGCKRIVITGPEDVGFFQYHNKDRKGGWTTSEFYSSPVAAIKNLQLPSSNKANYRYEVRLPVGTTGHFCYLPDSTQQFFSESPIKYSASQYIGD